MTKKFLSLIMVILLVFSMGIGTVSVAANSDVVVKLDGEVLQFDVAPRLIGGRTMVPLRAIFEALGATVEWNDETKTVTAYNEAAIVKCTIGNNTMYVNEVAKTIDVAPMVVDSRTLVPARFIAESFNCDVTWDGDTKTVYIVSQPIDYNNLEKETDIATNGNQAEINDAPVVESQPVVEENVYSGLGTRDNPYSSSDGAVIPLQKWSFDPVRNVSVTCTNVIRGSSANSLAYSENKFNDSADANSEWIFMEFNVKYVSSTDGSDDVLEGSDVIYKDKFFKADGSALTVKDTATLSNKYKGYGVFDVEIYPGGSAKIVIGLLTEKFDGDVLLCVPNKGDNTNTWINCTRGTKSSSSGTTTSSSGNSGKTTTATTNTTSSNVTYYPGTTLPTYTSITGEPVKEIISKTYTYEYNMDDFSNYIVTLTMQYGWSEYKHETKDNKLTYYLLKGSNLIGVTYAPKYSEVWIMY